MDQPSATHLESGVGGSTLNSKKSCPKPVDTFRKVPPPSGGFAIIQDTNAGSISANAQSVDLVAPQTGNKQTFFSAFLNNVRTDYLYPIPPGYFLQNGLLFRAGNINQVIWTDDSHGLMPQTYNIPYVVGHTYRFIITFSSNQWYMVAEDLNASGTYTPIGQPAATGSHLRPSSDTSVFFENGNTNGNWKKAFSNPMIAMNAKIYVNGFAQSWTADDQFTQDACAASYPTGNAMSGSLINNATANFLKGGVPLQRDGLAATC